MNSTICEQRFVMQRLAQKNKKKFFHFYWFCDTLRRLAFDDNTWEFV